MENHLRNRVTCERIPENVNLNRRKHEKKLAFIIISINVFKLYLIYRVLEAEANLKSTLILLKYGYQINVLIVEKINI